MSCKHAIVQQVGDATWCSHCGAIRTGSADWRLPQTEQQAVREDEMCPICEFGEPLSVEVQGDRKIWRWTCKHWIDAKLDANGNPIPRETS